MQDIANGVDLIELSRIEKLLISHGSRFLNRVFTKTEQDYANKNKSLKTEKLAGRFAAKESVLKLIGTGWRGKIAWTDIEIVNDFFGKPIVNLSGEVKKLADETGLGEIKLSITHTKEFAIASAVAIINLPDK
jgi:holo-[acyl-carrier protein] synthase